MKKYTLAIHGGAGAIPPTVPEDQKILYFEALEKILKYGNKLLKKGETALNTVELVVNKFEDCPLFNCGKGSVFTFDGGHSMDASIMDGKNRQCGAVTGITRIQHPVSLAKDVMSNSKYVFLNGKGAEEFAKELGYKFKNKKYFDTVKRYEQWRLVQGSDKTSLDHNAEFAAAPKGTVGAVALDIYGDLAAATSTGGMTNKKWDRIGDSPVIGAGTFADNSTCAVSCTGEGEEFIKNVIAFDIHALMMYKGLSLKDASEYVTHKVLKKGIGGLIAVDKEGNFSLPYNTLGMYRGVATSKGIFEVKIWE
ncbi:MAG: isoaspartyl peptidase/L-asparaginase [Candidatus Delongbacteria bacterium]|nr:isoaspartyl peptidase/L-asparaginase [Candidatus Delongbacteria bacterium]